MAALHLDEGEATESFDGMIVLNRDDDRITSHHSLLNSIHYKDAFTFYEGSDLGTMVVNLVTDVPTRVKRDSLGEAMATIGILGIIQHTIGAPAPLLVHWT